MKDQYAGFAERYDLPYGLTVDPRMGEFFGKLFAEHRVRRVLDCACGTGRHLLLFHALGCEVCGSDVSPSMLEQAERNLASANASIPLRQADFRRLPETFTEQFDAVVCLGAIGYMPDEAQFLQAFASISQMLRKDGILALSAIPTDRQWQEKMGIKPWCSEGCFCLGELYADIGKREKALQNLKKAERMFQEMGMDYWLARTKEVMRRL